MCAVRFALIVSAAQVWHVAPGQKNRNVLAQLVYKVLDSVKFNMTCIYFKISRELLKATWSVSARLRCNLDAEEQLEGLVK